MRNPFDAFRPNLSPQQPYSMRHLLVLANSRKDKARCLAGREVLSKPGEPLLLGKWIRPLGTAPEGAVPESWVRDINVWDVVRIPLVAPTNDLSQPENWKAIPHDSVPWEKETAFSKNGQGKIVPVESPAHLWIGNIPYPKNDRIPANVVRENPFGWSLAIVEARKISFAPGFNGKGWRARFEYGKIKYDLSLTDPGYCQKLNENFSSWMGPVDSMKLCVSLTHATWLPPDAPHPYHYKVVATVFLP